jgi:hypothetical protein
VHFARSRIEIYAIESQRPRELLGNALKLKNYVPGVM